MMIFLFFVSFMIFLVIKLLGLMLFWVVFIFCLVFNICFLELSFFSGFLYGFLLMDVGMLNFLGFVFMFELFFLVEFFFFLVVFFDGLVIFNSYKILFSFGWSDDNLFCSLVVLLSIVNNY